MRKRSISDVDVRGRTVFVRVDFNVPLGEDGGISDETRIRAALPTLESLVFNGARVVVASHLGRPGGRPQLDLTMDPLARRLAQLLERPVNYNGLIFGEVVEAEKARMRDGDVLLLENLRFHPGEKANDPEFAASLAKGIDIFCNDAFGTCHRRHASIVSVAPLCASAVAGLLVKTEVEQLSPVLESDFPNGVLLLGGAKVADKIPLIRNLLGKTGTILIGGRIAYTFMKARGEAVGASEIETQMIPECEDILRQAQERGIRVILPVDHVAAVTPEANVTIRMVNRGEVIPPDMLGLDIGPRTVELFSRELSRADVVVWNGPMGMFEHELFSAGTMELAKVLAASSATVVAGGGDTVAAIRRAGAGEQLAHLSTGGGAALAFLSGETLPGLEVLEDMNA
ncbi:MAG: phosphoglycerate kinase [Acidobacteriota bacterium]|jgi:phosphoglycerate kinase|nr:phosphoglycerate kinase [Acidobacteriota bacterium]